MKMVLDYIMADCVSASDIPETCTATGFSGFYFLAVLPTVLPGDVTRVRFR
jgi:hypothetical protein